MHFYVLFHTLFKENQSVARPLFCSYWALNSPSAQAFGKCSNIQTPSRITRFLTAAFVEMDKHCCRFPLGDSKVDMYSRAPGSPKLLTQMVMFEMAARASKPITVPLAYIRHAQDIVDSLTLELDSLSKAKRLGRTLETRVQSSESRYISRL